MRERFFILSAVSSFMLICMCYHGVPQKERLAYVGSTLITRQDADAFSNVLQYYPNPPKEFYLGTRTHSEAVVQTEAIYRKTRWNFSNIKLRHSLDWKWRERYYISCSFMERIIKGNFGYTDKELMKYYNRHKKDYMPITYDSTGKACTTGTPRSFEQVKSNVARKMAVAAYPPDSVFKSTIKTVDTSLIMREWVRYLRDRGIRDILFNRYFSEKYGRAYPDSLGDIYGKGKVITPEDMKVMISWLPANRREQMKNNPKGMKELADWLLRWKLFSQKAVSRGYTSQSYVQNMLKWAWRIEIAQRYINEKLAPLATKDIPIDTEMTVYSLWDETETVGPSIDTAAWKKSFSKHRSQQVTVKFDSLLYEIRRSEGVRFLGEWKDEKAKDPVALIRQADSLRDTGNTNGAQLLYQKLVDNYFFTKEGKRAIIEVAKIKTEQQMYREAIARYRRFLVIDTDRTKKCNYLFMIGFIYDEYYNRPALAEVNYKWVLKNTPDCELADDAEFMMLHLGEQMAGVDELQAEVRRQGKKVEAAQTDTMGLTVEMVPADKK